MHCCIFALDVVTHVAGGMYTVMPKSLGWHGTHVALHQQMLCLLWSQKLQAGTTGITNERTSGSEKNSTIVVLPAAKVSHMELFLPPKVYGSKSSCYQITRNIKMNFHFFHFCPISVGHVDK